MTASLFPPHSRLRLVEKPRTRRLEVRIATADGRSPFGMSRAFRITEDDLCELVDVVTRLEARCMTPLHHPCPRSHPHADQPNWRPASTFMDYIRNCQKGLEPYSDRRAAKLLGISRAELWRWKLMAELPEALFEALLNAERKPSVKALAAVGQAFKGGGKEADVEKCPHCGGVLRVRLRVSAKYRKIVDGWLANGGAP